MMRGKELTSDGVFVVIAAYNEAPVIAEVVKKLRAAYPNVIVVDDGSRDSTSARLAGTGIFLLRHSINRGQGAALQTGIEFALRQGADTIVTFDADGQHDVADIAALVAPVRAGECDVALGSRFLGSTQGIPFSRRITLKIGVLFTRIFSRIAITDTHNGLRAFSRASAASLRIRMDRMAHASEILDQIRARGWRYCEVPVRIHYTPYTLEKGQSSWNALKIATEFLLRKASK
jgi:glycosyltransferase involved in cell wall biosynthesis